MKTLKIIFLSFLVSAVASKAQNWNVFNPAYRYNYKFDNSQLVSQVLFVDSVKNLGSDSIYYLNRIGLNNIGNPSYNMPQFLQRSIKKFSNGLVMLYDTCKLVINPSCHPGQSWLFDSVANVNAHCLSKNGHITFGLSDTVKTIIVGTNDTIKLSKNFGLLQFPDLYNKNKYYKLVGIEHAATYDSIPFYGERVPNAWDIYNFNVGDRFCYSTYYFRKNAINGNGGSNGNFTIKGKMITQDGYSYIVEGAVNSWADSVTSTVIAHSSNTFSSISFTDLSGPSRVNTMYPGKLILEYFPYPFEISNIASFGLDNHGVFYKYAGSVCSQLSSDVIFPTNSGSTYDDPFKELAEIYGVGLGRLRFMANVMTGDYIDTCEVCAVKNGSLYFGTETFVGIKEQTPSSNDVKLYPNPFREDITVGIGSVAADELRVTNILGEIVFQTKTDLKDQMLQIPMRDQSTGIYMVQVFNNSELIYTRKIVKN